MEDADVTKTPNLIERAKQQIDVILHTTGPNRSGKALEPVKSKQGLPLHHHEETHGRSNDIDEDTPIDAVKGPNVLQRAKEEIEALVQTIHPKKEPSSKREGGFRLFIANALQKVCHPWDPKKD
uniref:Uncharacterized protein n=1 Tax=Kalanchoe fedtschenkoi TaxID=63787 RepID=A0A7N0TQZ5_KALFE